MINLLPLFMAVPLGAAFLCPLLARLDRRLPAWAWSLTTLFLLSASIALYFFRSFNYILVYNLGGWLPPLGINLVLDGLSHLMLLVVNLVAFLVSLYSIAYLEKYTGKDKFATLYLLMLAGMNGVVLTGDLFNLFVFLEVAALSTYSLVAFGTEEDELEAAFRYLIIGSVASILILLGICLIYGLTGTLNLADIGTSFPPAAHYIRSFISVLFLVGFGMKAALMPFHAWLPDAHTTAPAPVSATLSGVLIKVLGVYAIIRILYNVLGMNLQLSYVLTFLAVVSILGGGLLALGQRDFKRLLAYSSISQIGYIVLGISLATPLGIAGGLFHLLNHAVFKPLLFLTAGSVEYATGTRDLKEMGGLSKKMPLTFATSLFGSLSISGLPPFNGFWSKLFIIIACIQAGRFWTAFAAVLGSILTLAYFLKVQQLAFFGKLPTKLENVKEVPFSMGLPMIVLAGLCLIFGLAFPLVLGFLINPAMIAVANGVEYSRMLLGGF